MPSKIAGLCVAVFKPKLGNPKVLPYDTPRMKSCMPAAGLGAQPICYEAKAELPGPSMPLNVSLHCARQQSAAGSLSLELAATAQGVLEVTGGSCCTQPQPMSTSRCI